MNEKTALTVLYKLVFSDEYITIWAINPIMPIHN